MAGPTIRVGSSQFVQTAIAERTTPRMLRTLTKDWLNLLVGSSRDQRTRLVSMNTAAAVVENTDRAWFDHFRSQATGINIEILKNLNKLAKALGTTVGQLFEVE